jgi:hypothetical protein
MPIAKIGSRPRFKNQVQHLNCIFCAEFICGVQPRDQKNKDPNTRALLQAIASREAEICKFVVLKTIVESGHLFAASARN